MKLYSNLKPMLVYNQNGFVLPRGDKPGFEQAVFLLSPNKDQGYSLLNDGFLDFKRGLYKKYMIDFVYKEKIGYKRYVKNNTGMFRKEFNEMKFPATLTMITNANKVSYLKKGVNVLINLGEWNDIYFKFQVKKSFQRICEEYLHFINDKISDDNLKSYNKILYIDIDQWITGNKKLGLDRKNLTNPISILLVSIYKFPEIISILGDIDIVFVNSKLNRIMKVNTSDLTKQNYIRFKQRLMSMINKSDIDEDTINETVIDNPEKSENTSINKDREALRKDILNNLTKNLMGPVDDITDEIDNNDDSEIQTDDDDINEIKTIANNYMDEHPELLDGTNPDVALKEVTDAVKKTHYVRSFIPQYTDEQLKRIHELADIQSSVIGDMTQSLSDMKSKTIDESDFSNVVSTNNADIIKAKFVNFDKSYNKKKLHKDIDNCVAMLSNASNKVFITSKTEEDTSTALDLKKTLTYTLQDENGKKMKISFDVPIIFDDHYMMIKGNKKVIEHMLILNPLVKTDDDTVQIVSNYQKMFIMRTGSVDLKTNALLKFLLANKEEFDVVTGNGLITNKNMKTTIEYNTLAKKIIRFKCNQYLFILESQSIFDILNKSKIKYDQIDLSSNVIIGIDTVKNKPLVISINDSFVDFVLEHMDQEYVNAIKRIGAKSNGRRLLAYSRTKPMNKEIPLVVLLCLYEGFDKVMKKAGIEYEIIDKDSPELKEIDLFEWGLIRMEDGYIKWKRYPTENSLLMNGFNGDILSIYSTQVLESKDTYVNILTRYYNYPNQSYNLDQYYDFMIDPITKEILMDKNLPTDLVSLCLLANKMLKTEEYTPEGDLRNMRLRSNEVIAYHTYKVITDAYNAYRKSQHKRSPDPITVNKNAVIKRLSAADRSVMTDASVLNPVLEAASLHKVTYKGEAGTNEEHAFKLNVRAYNDTMLGVLGITTSNDAQVGINRQLTLEPNITSTRGYIDVAGRDNIEDLNSANLLTPTELLTPLGVQHDDPARTAMAFKQGSQMMLIEDSDSVLIGNGAEKILPYHLSSEFSVVAEDDGVVIDKTGDMVVIKYKNGRYRTIDTSLKIKKNSSAGFYIPNKLTCNKEIGDKVVKNEVVAWNNEAYGKNGNDPDVSMKLGPLVKIAIIPEWDIYEDSAPITASASKRLSTNMVMPVTVSLSKDAYVERMVKVGDHVEAGDNVIVFDNYPEDETMKEFFKNISADLKESIIESNNSTKKTHYSGTVIGIDVLTTVELDQLSESLRNIVSKHWKEIKKKDKILEKYRNSDDYNFYKSGNVVTDVAKPVEPDMQGKVRGTKVGEGVLITFYIAFKDIMARGDKLTAEFALKSITSHVIDEGLEPYSEFRPDENIDMITAPLSISARKTPSIFLAMFANKLLIEAKRHLKDYWENN